jgi:hypothetical protein
MNENKLKHLDFIQAIITRMNSNSFMLKGWCITLVSALFALAAKDADPKYVVIAFIPLPAFYLLDAFYLSRERQYRDLYSRAAVSDPNSVDFSMDARPYNKGRSTWFASLGSLSVWLFYGIAAVTVAIVMFVVQGPHHG